jgi:hypothetical protein
MNSLTMTCHGVTSARRHGRSRAFAPYQLSRRVTTRPHSTGVNSGRPTAPD